MEYLYEAAGLHVRCHVPFSVQTGEESLAFVRPANGTEKSDLLLTLKEAVELPELPQGGHWGDTSYYVRTEHEQIVFRCDCVGGTAFACTIWPDGEREIQCSYLPGWEKELCYSRNLWGVLGLERLLAWQNGLLLHASFIRWKGKGILFSAPSGTGKSTQADLWAKYEGAEIINGDRAGLVVRNGHWTAWGLPYAGSSRIYRNEDAPVCALVALRQGKENRLRKLNAAEAFPYFYPECSIHRWDKAEVSKSMGLLLGLLAETPVYLLECLPDRDAVETLRRALSPSGTGREGR